MASSPASSPHKGKVWRIQQIGSKEVQYRDRWRGPLLPRRYFQQAKADLVYKISEEHGEVQGYDA